MAHEVERLFNEIKWAIQDRVASVRGAVGQAQDMAGEQWANLMVKSYAAHHQMTEGQARTALILIGVAVTTKAPATPPPGKLAEVFRFVSRAVRVVL